jgi:twinkle protein
MNDNLSQDQYRQQTAFVKALAAMAKKFNVLIFLVAHPRKTFVREFSNDDVAGSSNITNLVDVVIRYSRPRDDETDAPRVLNVLKNRLNGRLTKKPGIPLYYNDGSKRISECLNFGWKMGWEDVTEGREEPLPF